MVNVNDPQGITVLNILNEDPIAVAQWASIHIIGVRVPEPGPNTAVTTLMSEIQTLLAKIPNRMGLATELYGIVVAAKANQQAAKRFEKNIDVENAITTMTAIETVLYRCIQTLQTIYDGTSRLITVGEQQSRTGRGT
jgi:hypothetical protein